MATLIGFVVALLQSVVDLVTIFVTDVALSDPLSTISFLVGAGVMTLTLGYLAFLVLGMVGAELGIGVTPGSRGTPARRE